MTLNEISLETLDDEIEENIEVRENDLISDFKYKYAIHLLKRAEEFAKSNGRDTVEVSDVNKAAREPYTPFY